jgi:hypothetical protein
MATGNRTVCPPEVLRQRNQLFLLGMMLGACEERPAEVAADAYTSPSDVQALDADAERGADAVVKDVKEHVDIGAEDRADVSDASDAGPSVLTLEFENHCGETSETVDFGLQTEGQSQCTYIVWNRTAAHVGIMHVCSSGTGFTAGAQTQSGPSTLGLDISVNCDESDILLLAADSGLRFNLKRTEGEFIVDGEVSFDIVSPETRVVRFDVVGQ